MQTMGRSRPLGITIIAIIVAIYGVLSIIAGIGLLSAGVTVPGVIGLILGVLQLILAWGLWTLQPWAFWATVIIEVITLLDGIYALVRGTSGPGIVTIVIALIVLIYLFADRNVRAAFRT